VVAAGPRPAREVLRPWSHCGSVISCAQLGCAVAVQPVEPMGSPQHGGQPRLGATRTRRRGGARCGDPESSNQTRCNHSGCTAVLSGDPPDGRNRPPRSCRALLGRLCACTPRRTLPERRRYHDQIGLAEPRSKPAPACSATTQQLDIDNNDNRTDIDNNDNRAGAGPFE
jgi:hypothetical protein